MNAYNPSDETHNEQLRKNRFVLRQKAFMSGDFSCCKFSLINNTDSTRPHSQIVRDEIILETDTRINNLVNRLNHNFSLPSYSQLPRERRLFPDLEEDIVKTYFNDDLFQWNKYLKIVQDEFGKVHPYGVCLYIREVGLPFPIPEDNSTNHSIRLSTRKEILARIHARKRAQKKKK